MRPLRLVIQAFGPFSATETVDFDAFGNNALFLINGPTGAGKSTLLDAICVALYGDTTGAERNPVQMRCDHADPALLTELTLDFELSGNRFRVTRIPKQERPRAKGEGVTVQNSDATLWQLFADKKPELMLAKGVTQVNQTIYDITGLSVEQFRQVMVLPQGKFRELLLANSRSREAIFSQLFQTQIFERIAERLKSEAANIKKEVTAHQNKIEGILQNAGVTSESDLQEKLAELLPKLPLAKEKKAKLNRQQLEAHTALDAAQRLVKLFKLHQTRCSEFEQLNQQADQINLSRQLLNAAKQADKLTPVYQQLKEALIDQKTQSQALEQATSAFQQAKQLHQQASEHFTLASQQMQQCDDLKQQLRELERLQSQVDELSQAQLQCETVTRSLNLALANYQRNQELVEALSQKISKLEQQIKDDLQKTEPLTEVTVQQADLQRRLAARHDLEALYLKLQEAEQHGRVARDQRDAAQIKFDQLSQKTSEIELQWHTGQAALLAEQLKQDLPCPVCGSIDHPAPAHLPKNGETLNLVSQEQVSQAREAKDAQLRILTDAKVKHSELQAHWKNLGQQIQEAKNALGEAAEQSIVHLEEQLRQLNQTLRNIHAYQSNVEKGKGELERLRAQQQQQASESERLQNALNEAHRDKALKDADIARLKRSVPEEYCIAGALGKAISEHRQKISRLTDLLEQATTRLEKANSELSKCTEGQRQRQEQLTEVEKRAQQKQANWDEALQQSDFIDEEAYQQALVPHPEQLNLSNQIKEYDNYQIELKGQIKQLADELQGQVFPQLEQLQQQYENCQLQYQQADADFNRIDSQVNGLKKTKNDLERVHKKNDQLEARYKVYGTLSDVANGKTGNHISLQRFVLAVLLDDVLLQASHRLQLMSKGRYQLLRKKDASSGNGASGLELEVEDAYSGKNRAVATLSGGESFLAALSLALGLSDVVQSYAGGIRLDTLFIDEGFGSLDSDSLDLALRTLIDLQKGGRMIGIISHVAELKEQMAMRLDIVSTKTGSHIKRVCE